MGLPWSPPIGRSGRSAPRVFLLESIGTDGRDVFVPRLGLPLLKVHLSKAHLWFFVGSESVYIGFVL